MPLMKIHREPTPPRLIRPGYYPTIIEPVVEPIVPVIPPPVTTNKRGRKKKMSEGLEEVGTKIIREDDAGEQGAVGSHGENAPAQEKTPNGDNEGEQDKEME